MRKSFNFSMRGATRETGLGEPSCKSPPRKSAAVSRGFTVALNRVCNIDGVCAACRLGEEQFGTEDLEGVVKSNILMVEMARSSRPKKK